MKKIQNQFHLLLIAILISSAGNAQIKQNTGWLASFNTIKLNKSLSLHAELQLRSTDDWQQIQTILPRVGLNYHFKPNQVLTMGYAYIPNRVSVNGESALLAEHRIFQQYIFNHKAWSASVAHRFRLEERFVPQARFVEDHVEKSGDLYSTRFRYFIRGIIPFTNKKPFEKGMFAALQNEIFLNVTNKENVNDQVFDQNRVYGAIGYRVSKKLDIEAGWLLQYVARRPQVGGNFNNDISNRVIQLAIYSRL
jgi:hypothetical protein